MELKNLQQIFNDKFFRVPDYQRGYSWEDDQLKDLWRDIQTLQEGKDHYIGVLSVKEDKGRDVFIVDGQQRTISLVILIQAILNRAGVLEKTRINGRAIEKYEDKYLREQLGSEREIDDKPIFGYDEDNPSHVHFKKEILKLSGTGSVPSPTLYTHNLDNALKFFQDKVSSMEFEELNSLFVKVTENLKFNYYALGSDFDECVVFESMNNRGKLLSALELLKNRLIYLGTLLPPHGEQEEEAVRSKRDMVNGAWKTIYKYLGKGSESLDDDEFLRDHWIMNFPDSKKKSQGYREFLLRQHFTAEKVHSGDLDYPAIRKYAEDIEGAVKPFYYLNYPRESAQESGYSPEIKEWLFKLKRLGCGDFQPLLISALMRRGEDDSQIVTLLKAAERFLFVAFNVEIQRADYRRSAFYRMARQYHTENLGLGEVISKLEGFHLEKFSEEEFQKKIQQYDESFYGWKGITYFLYEYELYLQRENGGETERGYVNADTIEHIFPRNPGEGWERFDQKDLLHDLGNLLLLSKSNNPKLGNRPFAEKKEKVFRRASYSAIEVSEYSDWTPESVKDRRKKLLAFLVERWNLTPTK